VQRRQHVDIGRTPADRSQQLHLVLGLLGDLGHRHGVEPTLQEQPQGA
jgi:hypothetical protein